MNFNILNNKIISEDDKLFNILINLHKSIPVIDIDVVNTVYKLVSDSIPKLSNETIDKITSFGLDTIIKSNYWLTHYYTNRMSKYNIELDFLSYDKRKSNVLTAGFFCFVGQFIMYLSYHGLNPNQNQEDEIHGLNFMDLAFSYSLMYVYSDYFLDGVNGDQNDRMNIMLKLINILYNPHCLDADSVPKLMSGLVNTYRHVIDMVPHIHTYLVKIFLVEVEGLKYQESNKYDRIVYLDIAIRKGGYTGLALVNLMKTYNNTNRNDIEDTAYTIGAILQILDDIFDVYEDEEDKIHTIATHDLSVYGNLDILFHYTIILIQGISDHFHIFKPILTIAACYTLGHKGKYSSDLISKYQGFLYFGKDITSNIMVVCDKWMQKLITDILQKDNVQ